MDIDLWRKTEEYRNAQRIYEECVKLRDDLLKYVREDVISNVRKLNKVRSDIRSLYVKTEELRDIGKDFKFEPDSDNKDTPSRFSPEHISFIQMAARDVIAFIQQYQMSSFMERTEMISGMLALMTLFIVIIELKSARIIEIFSFEGILIIFILSVLIILFAKVLGHCLFEISRHI